MALVKCIKCGKMISEHAKKCPECGYFVGDNERKCPECGNIVAENIAICNQCGYPFDEGNNIEYTSQEKSLGHSMQLEMLYERAIAKKEEVLFVSDEIDVAKMFHDLADFKDSIQQRDKIIRKICFDRKYMVDMKMVCDFLYEILFDISSDENISEFKKIITIKNEFIKRNFIDLKPEVKFKNGENILWENEEAIKKCLIERILLDYSYKEIDWENNNSIKKCIDILLNNQFDFLEVDTNINILTQAKEEVEMTNGKLAKEASQIFENKEKKHNDTLIQLSYKKKEHEEKAKLLKQNIDKVSSEKKYAKNELNREKKVNNLKKGFLKILCCIFGIITCVFLFVALNWDDNMAEGAAEKLFLYIVIFGGATGLFYYLSKHVGKNINKKNFNTIETTYYNLQDEYDSICKRIEMYENQIKREQDEINNLDLDEIIIALKNDKVNKMEIEFKKYVPVYELKSEMPGTLRYNKIIQLTMNANENNDCYVFDKTKDFEDVTEGLLLCPELNNYKKLIKREDVIAQNVESCTFQILDLKMNNEQKKTYMYYLWFFVM